MFSRVFSLGLLTCTLLSSFTAFAAPPPTVASVNPAPGTDVTTLTQVTVTFSAPVAGVNADDFLLNTQPAAEVSGSGATYTFTFGQPLYGLVAISWFPDHGITDLETPAQPFDATAPSANWLYHLLDQVPPTVTRMFPAPDATVRSLRQAEVTFSEEVTGLEAGDLLVNGRPATSLRRRTVDLAYVFEFAPPTAAGAVRFEWASGHGITDQATPANAFAGGSWSVTYNPDASQGDLVITEFLAANQAGLLDENAQQEDWIEIYNRGPNPVNLLDWSLSNDADVPGLWTFPSRTLGSRQYLVVFASGLDRKSTTGSNRMHTNFQLGRGSGHLGLYTPDSPRVLASGFDPYPDQRNDNSYGIDPTGALRYFATPTPGASNGFSTIVGVVEPVHFSTERGFFTAPFTLALTTPTPGARIRYTTDGSEPTPLTGFSYALPIRITNTTLLRAAAFKNNFLPSTVGTHSYLFNFTAVQRSLPIMNVVTATNNLIGRTGIIGMGGGTRASDGLFITNNRVTDFHNPSAHGIAWERPVSFEYILPQDNSGFQIDCGIRVQGSDWQRPRTLPTSKFSFRLYFRGDYGAGRLNYPLFPLTTVNSFDQLVLRAGFNEQVNPFIRDEIIRRMSSDMGEVAAHGGLSLLLLNGGMYTNNTGLTPVYNPCERVHEEFMQSHLGGGFEWDVVGPDFAVSSEGLGVVDGDRNNFNSMVNYVWNQQNATTITNPAIYSEVARRLDVTNFVDYCLLNAYVAMGDWPANNWRAGRERSTNGIWRFIAWDAEWGMGIYSLAVTRDSFAFSGSGTEDAGLNSTGNSEIARLYQRLRPNREFRLLWADRIQKHFYQGGALTGLNISNRFAQLRAELLGFIPSIDVEILDWARARPAIIMSQFNTYGLYGFSNALYGVYASSNAPIFSQHGGRVPPGFSLTMNAPLGGQIYYTLNGDEPRVPFTGAVSNSATLYSGPITLAQSAVVKARTLLNGTNWSAINVAEFTVGTRGVPLRISEIMYNPLGGTPYEYIELHNTGPNPLDLTGMYFDGITFVFNVGSVLNAGQRLVLAANTDTNAWVRRYPSVRFAGAFGGSLNNGGERITLFDRNGTVITSVEYRDTAGWPTAADGAGNSLELIDPSGDPNAAANWRASATTNGTPGLANTVPATGAVRLNEIGAVNVASVPNGGTFPDWIELENTGGSAVNLAGWSLSDDGNARKFVFPASATISAGTRLVVWCDAITNTTPGLHTGFTLDASGESLFLYDPSTNVVDAVAYGIQIADFTLGRIGADWTLTTPTPNNANVAATLGSATNLALNEWMANPTPGNDDYIELFNRSAEPVALRGTYLATSNAIQQITSLSFIAPNGWALFHADENPGADHLNFRLPSVAGAIIFYDITAAEVQRVTYGAQAQGVSAGRLPDGAATVGSFPGTASPGAMNYTATYAGPVVSEILARNQTVLTAAGRVEDWFELVNNGASAFDLGGMSLSVNSAEPGEWRFPPNTTLAPGAFLVIACDGSRLASTNAPDFNTGESLDGESGGIYLFNAAGQMVHSVEYGFQVPDLSIGLSGGAFRLLGSPTPGAANSVAATLGAVTGLRLNEWMAAPDGGSDWFEIHNPATHPVDMGNLYLTDTPTTFGLTQYRIAPLSFVPASGFVKWVADNDAGAGRNHVNFDLDKDGDYLRLVNTNGSNVIDSIVIAAQVRGVSEGRLLDGSEFITSFPSSASPGESNYQLLPNVVINEALTHTDRPLEDAVELHNPTSAPASVGGWYLSDQRDVPRKYRIADGTVIPAGGFLVLYENQINTGPNAFTLDSVRGDELWLSATDGAGNLTGQRAGVRFGAAANGVSFGRIMTSVGADFAALSARTFGQDNPGTVAQFRTGTGAANAAPRVGPVIINELMYNPPPSPSGADDEYVEILNTTGSPVPLFDPAFPTNRWRLSGGVDFTFPANQTLPANGFALVVNFDPADTGALALFRLRYGLAASVRVYGPYRGRLGNGGDNVELSRPDAPQGPGPDAGFVPYILVDRVNYTDEAPWPSGAVDGGGLSLQRRGPALYGNEPINWLASTPTPGAANGVGATPVPTITSSPQNLNALVDNAVSFSVGASGGAPLSYRWRFNGVPIPDATNATFTLPFVQLDHVGSYDAIVSNPSGSAVSRAASLIVNAPPFVLGPPANVTTRGGSNVLFSVVAQGTAPITYQWLFQGAPILGATSPSYLRTNVGLADFGTYGVRITNPFGSVTTNADLIVLVGPTIVQQPANITVAQGAPATFSISAAGTPPMGFRWRSNGTTVAFQVVNQVNATAFYTIGGAARNAAITVVVTNGVVTSGVLSGTGNLVVLTDTDGDGLPDEVETALGLNPNSAADAALDADGDGLSNLEEYLAGTNPNDAQSFLKIERIAFSGGANVTFNTVSNHTYTVLYNDRVVGGTWRKLADVPARTENRQETVYDPTGADPARFYRLVTPVRP